jgi:hypothetical protein
MRALFERFVRGESGLTAYGLIAAALMLIGVGAWVVVPAHRVVVPQINPLEMMANAKDLPASLAIANGPPATGARPPAGNSVAPGPTFQTEHHRKMYMSAKSVHKHKQLKPAHASPGLTQRSVAGNVN